jgi:hypothetical protein
MRGKAPDGAVPSPSTRSRCDGRSQGRPFQDISDPIRKECAGGCFPSLEAYNQFCSPFLMPSFSPFTTPDVAAIKRAGRIIRVVSRPKCRSVSCS